MITCHRRTDRRTEGCWWSLHYFLVFREGIPSRTDISQVGGALLFDKRSYVGQN